MTHHYKMIERNILLVCGDLLLLCSVVSLLLNILKTKSCAGVSGKSQILYSLVFTTRYVDIFFTHVSLYNSLVKIFILCVSYAILYLIYFKFKATYYFSQNTFRIEFLLFPSAVIAILACRSLDEVLYNFSLCLECIAIVPQLFLVSKMGKLEPGLRHYLITMGFYRAFYVLFWIYRFFNENYLDTFQFVTGLFQSFIFVGFLYFVVG